MEFSSEDSDSESELVLNALLKVVKGRRGSRKFIPSLGDIIEVYWVDEKKWYEGEVIDTREDGEYKVSYVSDGKKLWHTPGERVRMKKD